MNKPPLRLFLLAHQKSAPGKRLAEALMMRFMEPPASGGLRIPVFLTPDRGDDLPPEWEGDGNVNLDFAEHTVVVVLSDGRMAATELGGTGDQWEAFLKEGARRAPIDESPHRVFGVAVGNDGFALSDARHMLHATAEPPDRNDNETDEDFADRIDKWIDAIIDDLTLEITVPIIQLFEPRAEANEQRSPFRLFLSHAKADLDKDDKDVVRYVEDSVRELPVKYWFDACEIPPGAEFEGEITAGLRDCSIVVAFVTDQYATRFWCQREVLDAKRMGLPILVVNALVSGEPRNFPYLGNLPTINWTGADPKNMSRRIVARAVREALRFMVNRATLARYAGTDDVVLASAPEAITLSWYPGDTAERTRFLYPDPPLTSQELTILNGLREHADFETPLTRVARRGLPPTIHSVGVSISESDDLKRFGLSKWHEQTLTDEIHLYLLLAGLQIAYGGALIGDFSKGSNFTLRLFELVKGYSQLARDAGGEGLRPILNYPPWPLVNLYGDRERKLLKKSVVRLVMPTQPPANEIPDAEQKMFGSDTPERRLAWTRGLTLMRIQMTRDVQARVVIGGSLGRKKPYSGLYPGIVEEAWMSIVAGAPLYLVGAFGGAARAVIEAIKGDATTFLDSCASVPDHKEVVDLAEQRGMTMVDTSTELNLGDLKLDGLLVRPARMAADLAETGKRGLSAALNNGLSDEDNEELFRSIDATRIAEIILSGLARIG